MRFRIRSVCPLKIFVIRRSLTDALTHLIRITDSNIVNRYFLYWNRNEAAFGTPFLMHETVGSTPWPSWGQEVGHTRMLTSIVKFWSCDDKLNTLIGLEGLRPPASSESQQEEISAIMANPRKFSEKIALHNQKQAEETAAFEAIMREVVSTKELPGNSTV